MRYGILFFLLAASPAVWGGESIDDKTDLDPRLDKLRERIREVNQGKAKAADVVAFYRQQALEPVKDKRKEAMRVFMYGVVLQSVLNDAPAARREFERALQSWPDFPRAHLHLAMLALGAHNPRTAKRHLKAALRIDRQYNEALLLRARIALKDDDLDLAERLFVKSFDVAETPAVCMGLQDVYTRRWKESANEKEKKKWADRVIGAAQSHLLMSPTSGLAHLFLAKAYRDLGMIDKAIASLEDSYATADLIERDRLEILFSLIQAYRSTNQVEKVKSALDRILKLESLTPAQRSRFEQMRKDLAQAGTAAFTGWEIDKRLDILKNEGISETVRRSVLRDLIEMLGNEMVLTHPYLREKAAHVFDALLHQLISAPPSLSVEILRWLRKKVQDPALVRILVHFIYPFDDAQRPPAVRVEAVRTLEACCGLAALPALLYCLSDLNGEAMREVDRGLQNLLETRSVVGGSIKPLTDEEMGVCRRQWMKAAHSPNGAEKLKLAFQKLAGLVEHRAKETREQRSAPLVDHAVSLVILDDDMQWIAWKAAYEFLLKYWDKDYRPVGRRGKPVQESERARIVELVRADWTQSKMRAPQPKEPGGKPKPKKPNEKSKPDN